MQGIRRTRANPGADRVAHITRFKEEGVRALTAMLLCAVAGLAGCSSGRAPVSTDLPQYHGREQERDVLLPEVGAHSRAAVGDSMVSVARERIRVDLTVEPVTLTGHWPSEPTLTYSIELPGGTYQRVGMGDTGEYFKVGPIAVTWHYQGKKPYSEPFVAYLYRSRRSLDLLWHYPGSTEQYGSSTVKAKTERKESVSGTVGPSFRRELVYTGRAGNTISLLYREFQNDMARPAFSQQLQYDIGADPIIGYKGARFRIFAADNTSISYEVLAQLPGF